MYGRISLPAYIHTTDSAEVFFHKIYPMEQMQLQGITRDTSFFRDRAILTIKNDTVADINVRILTRLAGETRVYDAVDSISFNIMERVIGLMFLSNFCALRIRQGYRLLD